MMRCSELYGDIETQAEMTQAPRKRSTSNRLNVSDTLSTEWGGVNNVRFFTSEQGSITPNASLLGNDVANVFVVAKEAYKVVWQAGGKARFIYLPPGLKDWAQAKSSLIDLDLLAA